MVRMLIVVSCLFLAGCGQPVADFAAGFGAGAVTAINSANQSMEQVHRDTAALNEKAAELEVLIEGDPITLLNTLDPNLGAAINRFILNAQQLKQDVTTEKGKVDWNTILVGLLATFAGGTGVNMYKNAGKKG